MIIENETRVTKKLLGKFCFANMFYQGRNILIIIPMLLIFLSLIIFYRYPKLEWLFHTTTTLVIGFQLFIVALNVILFHKNMAMYPKQGRMSRIDFSDEGIFVGGVAREKKIDYSYVLECVEFHAFFIMYFTKSSPIVIDKDGFKKSEVAEFKNMMKRNIKKGSRKLHN